MIIAPDATQKLARFVGRSPEALLQLLVAAAGKPTFGRIDNCPRYPVPVRNQELVEALEDLHGLLKQTDAPPCELLARLYVSAYSKDHRKRAGQFFTPLNVAKWTISKVQPDAKDVVWDAGAGTAVFAQALLQHEVHVRAYVGVEVDPTLALCGALTLEALAAPSSYRIRYANFLHISSDSFSRLGIVPPTLLISNPPFVRFHNIAERSSILASIGVAMGFAPSSLSGASNYFLCKAAELASPRKPTSAGEGHRPRLVFLLPREAVGAAHARRLRADLHAKHGWEAKELTIPRRLLSETIIQRNALAVCFMFDRNAKPGVKALADENKPSLGDILRVNRGIATGKNEFFVLTDPDARARHIPRRYLKPVLPTKIPLLGEKFSSAQWDSLRDAGRPCWLLALPNVTPSKLEPAVQTYLKEGVRRGLHQTATAMRLATWYALPVPDQPPDVFITYLFRGAPRFIANDARVHYLTNILGGRFRCAMNAGVSCGTVISMLNGRAKEWVRLGPPWREYRDGLCKIEPRELSRLPVDSTVMSLLQWDQSTGDKGVMLLFR